MNTLLKLTGIGKLRTRQGKAPGRLAVVRSKCLEDAGESMAPNLRKLDDVYMPQPTLNRVTLVDADTLRTKGRLEVGKAPPFNAIQQLTYGAVIFVLAPFQVLTGAAQSPAIEARFPWFVRLWGGRQWGRSLHFFGLLAFIGFIIHVLMVTVHGFGGETANYSNIGEGMGGWREDNVFYDQDVGI